MPDALPLLPTTVVGSHGLPGWLWLAREALAAGRLGATDVAELLRHVEPGKLWLTRDRGFWETPRWICRRKLEALVAGARRVRGELGG